MGDVTSKELTTRLKNMIVSVEGESDRNVINRFVDNELFWTRFKSTTKLH